MNFCAFFFVVYVNVQGWKDRDKIGPNEGINNNNNGDDGDDDRKRTIISTIKKFAISSEISGYTVWLLLMWLVTLINIEGDKLTIVVKCVHIRCKTGYGGGDVLIE